MARNTGGMFGWNWGYQKHQSSTESNEKVRKKYKYYLSRVLSAITVMEKVDRKISAATSYYVQKSKTMRIFRKSTGFCDKKQPNQ